MVGGRQVVGRKGAALLRLTGCSLLVLMFSMRHVDSIPHPISVLELYFHSLSALAFVLVIASTILGPQGSGWAKVLAKPALRYLGLISYSVYLWHEPILIELGRRGLLLNPAPEAFPMNAVILASLAVAVSAVSYWVIELPTMELRHLFASDRRLAQR
jgi:peptidoglycan/LPS O-acetylase OafA/YrhL